MKLMPILIEWSISSVLLILAVTALRALLGKRMGAELRYALWAVVLVRLLVPVQLFSYPVPVSALPEPNRGQIIEAVPHSPVSAAPGAVAGTSSDPGTDAPGAVAGTPSDPGTDAPGAAVGAPAIAEPVPNGGAADYELNEAPVPPPKAEPVDVFQVLGWLWLAGSAVMAAAFILSNLKFARRLRRVRVPLDGADCPLPVYIAGGLPSPCLFGLIHPAVYVTPEATDDPVMLRHVLAHEYTHFCHGDHIWNILRSIALAVHWWNPLVWLAVVLSGRDCELACDEGALKRLGDGERVAYGRTLLALLTAKPRPGDLLTCATTMTGGQKNVFDRVTRIARAPRRWLWAAVAAVLAAALACAFAFGRGVEPSASASPEPTQTASPAPPEPSPEPSASVSPEPAATSPSATLEPSPEPSVSVSPEPAATAPLSPLEELLAQQPIDNEHDAFLVDTGGRMGTLLVTAERGEEEEWDPEMEFDVVPTALSVWDPQDMDAPIQTMDILVWHFAFGNHKVVDANFDGYMDFSYMYTAGMKHQTWRLWVWDEGTGRFVEVPEYSKIPSPSCDPETEIIDGYASYTGLADGVTTFHRWEDGELVCVRRIETWWEPDEEVITDDIVFPPIHLTVEDRIFEELVLIHSEVLPPHVSHLAETDKWRDLNYHGDTASSLRVPVPPEDWVAPVFEWDKYESGLIHVDFTFWREEADGWQFFTGLFDEKLPLPVEEAEEESWEERAPFDLNLPSGGYWRHLTWPGLELLCYHCGPERDVAVSITVTDPEIVTFRGVHVGCTLWDLVASQEDGIAWKTNDPNVYSYTYNWFAGTHAPQILFRVEDGAITHMHVEYFNGYMWWHTLLPADE